MWGAQRHCKPTSGTLDHHPPALFSLMHVSLRRNLIGWLKVLRRNLIDQIRPKKCEEIGNSNLIERMISRNVINLLYRTCFECLQKQKIVTN